MVKDGSKNVDRALEILLILGEAGHEGRTLTELAARLKDNRSSVHRALATMIVKGFAESIGKRGGYRLGPAIYGIAQHTPALHQQTHRLRPALAQVADRTRHATYLLARVGLDAICMEMVLGTSPSQTLTGGVGGRVPLGIGPGSVSILATLDSQTRESIIDQNEPRFGSYSGQTAKAVREAVEQANILGYACEIGVFNRDGGGVAVALPERRGQSNFAISVATHSKLMTSAMIDETVQIMKEVTESLGDLD